MTNSRVSQPTFIFIRAVRNKKLCTGFQKKTNVSKKIWKQNKDIYEFDQTKSVVCVISLIPILCQTDQTILQNLFISLARSQYTYYVNHIHYKVKVMHLPLCLKVNC